MVSLAEVPLSWRIENALVSYGLYLWKTFWPVSLAAFYPPALLSLGNVALVTGVLIAISVWAVAQRKQRPYLLAGWLWYLGTLVPVIGLVQVGSQSMADRYAYIPLIGIFVIVAWLAAEAGAAWNIAPGKRAIIAGSWVVGLALVTWQQIGYWRSPVDLWMHAISVTGDNVIAENNLGIAFSELGRDDEASQHFRNAIRIKYSLAEAHINLGALLQKRGELPEAIQEYQAVLATSSDREDLRMANHNLGTAYRELGDLQTAREYYKKVLEIDPADANAMAALGRVELLAGAERLSNELARHPSAEGYQQLGELLEQAGKLELAEDAYEKERALRSRGKP